MATETLIKLLNEMAEIVDGPNGPGGGAILHEAVSTIEELQRRLPPAEPTTR